MASKTCLKCAIPNRCNLRNRGLRDVNIYSRTCSIDIVPNIMFTQINPSRSLDPFRTAVQSCLGDKLLEI